MDSGKTARGADFIAHAPFRGTINPFIGTCGKENNSGGIGPVTSVFPINVTSNEFKHLCKYDEPPVQVMKQEAKHYGRTDGKTGAWQYFQSLSGTGLCFILKNLGRDLNMERDSCLYGKGWKTTIAWNGDIINGFLLIIWSARGKWSLVCINVLHSILQFHFIAPLGTPDYYQRMLDSSELYFQWYVICLKNVPINKEKLQLF